LAALATAVAAAVAAAAINFTDVAFENGSKTFEITINLPVTFTISSTDGSVRIAGDAYVTPVFANGGGDLKADTLPEAVLELAQYLLPPRNSNKHSTK
jgi:hypothetical protein